MPNNGWNGSRGWKSIGPFFTWTMTLRRELAVQRRELVIGLLGAIVVVAGGVDEGTPDHDAVMRREGFGEHVRAVGMGAPIVLRSRLALGIRLDQEAAEIGDQPIHFVGLCSHQARTRVERIGGLQAAELDRRGEARRQIHADAVWPQCDRQAPPPCEVCGREDAASALTLLSTTPLMPIEALARA